MGTSDDDRPEIILAQRLQSNQDKIVAAIKKDKVLPGSVVFLDKSGNKVGEGKLSFTEGGKEKPVVWSQPSLEKDRMPEGTVKIPKEAVMVVANGDFHADILAGKPRADRKAHHPIAIMATGSIVASKVPQAYGGGDSFSVIKAGKDVVINGDAYVKEFVAGGNIKGGIIEVIADVGVTGVVYAGGNIDVDFVHAAQANGWLKSKNIYFYPRYNEHVIRAQKGVYMMHSSWESEDMTPPLTQGVKGDVIFVKENDWEKFVPSSSLSRGRAAAPVVPAAAVTPIMPAVTARTADLPIKVKVTVDLTLQNNKYSEVRELQKDAGLKADGRFGLDTTEAVTLAVLAMKKNGKEIAGVDVTNGIDRAEMDILRQLKGDEKAVFARALASVKDAGKAVTYDHKVERGELEKVSQIFAKKQSQAKQPG